MNTKSKIIFYGLLSISMLIQPLSFWNHFKDQPQAKSNPFSATSKYESIDNFALNQGQRIIEILKEQGITHIDAKTAKVLEQKYLQYIDKDPSQGMQDTDAIDYLVNLIQSLLDFEYSKDISRAQPVSLQGAKTVLNLSASIGDMKKKEQEVEHELLSMIPKIIATLVDIKRGSKHVQVYVSDLIFAYKHLHNNGQISSNAYQFIMNILSAQPLDTVNSIDTRVVKEILGFENVLDLFMIAGTSANIMDQTAASRLTGIQSRRRALLKRRR